MTKYSTIYKERCIYNNEQFYCHFWAVMVMCGYVQQQQLQSSVKDRLTQSSAFLRTDGAGTWPDAWLHLFIYKDSTFIYCRVIFGGSSLWWKTNSEACVAKSRHLRPHRQPNTGLVFEQLTVIDRWGFESLPDCEQFVQQVGCSGQQGPPGDVQGLLPPGVRAQHRHDASVLLQRDGDDVAIQWLLLLGGAQPERQAVIPPKLNNTRPGGGEASSPVHPPSVPQRLPPPCCSLRQSSSKHPQMVYVMAAVSFNEPPKHTGGEDISIPESRWCSAENTWRGDEGHSSHPLIIFQNKM